MAKKMRSCRNVGVGTVIVGSLSAGIVWAMSRNPYATGTANDVLTKIGYGLSGVLVAVGAYQIATNKGCRWRKR